MHGAASQFVLQMHPVPRLERNVIETYRAMGIGWSPRPKGQQKTTHDIGLSSKSLSCAIRELLNDQRPYRLDLHMRPALSGRIRDPDLVGCDLQRRVASLKPIRCAACIHFHFHFMRQINARDMGLILCAFKPIVCRIDRKAYRNMHVRV